MGEATLLAAKRAGMRRLSQSLAVTGVWFPARADESNLRNGWRCKRVGIGGGAHSAGRARGEMVIMPSAVATASGR